MPFLEPDEPMSQLDSLRLGLLSVALSREGFEVTAEQLRSAESLRQIMAAASKTRQAAPACGSYALWFTPGQYQAMRPGFIVIPLISDMVSI